MSFTFKGLIMWLGIDSLLIFIHRTVALENFRDVPTTMYNKVLYFIHSKNES